MKCKMYYLAFIASGILYTQHYALAAQQDACLTYDCEQMLSIKQRIRRHDAQYAPAWQALLQQADAALNHAVYSVTDKTLTPVSGNKHDYYSFGPYWWPNPGSKDGMPYIRKDGQINPDAKTNGTDSKRMVQFSNDVRALALAWFYSGEDKYAKKAQQLLQAWFLDSKTRMNPNLNYAQAIPGKVDGRGIGIIDTRVLIDVADSIVLLENSGHIPSQALTGYKKWYADYTQWLLTSHNGFEEANWYNNHGAWYDAQVTAFSLFTGQQQQASRQVEIFKLRHLISQVNAAGEITSETERTRSFHYTNFALSAYAHMGRYGEKVQNDVWGFELDNRTMKKAFALVSKQTGKPQTAWAHEDIRYTPSEATGPLLAAARAYQDADFINSAARLAKENSKDINILIPGSVLVK
ncbi:alginate lyase family protein [Salmonella enterica subsp. houtenae]|uniref:Alginate lyase family protein n=2 Tax=Salmonella enterica TaxID=28901 RepID=A0A5Y4Z7J7_SALER|nr:alginate lyase family protein [Salmonella enterica]EAA7390780.1 alginate lyase [Salmonella enterica subsp. enterica]ECE5934242.1 alginate lyase [Salmonella enterica subsp. houtenae]EDG3665426.1 alginate lyase [Salmonella enterica subsp. enterica serovar Give]EEP3165872.1 alginate lyase family protein [Salmonella enterica subsp. houtenae serovar 43:z4,z32:-]EHB3786021.1 alginate lyase family protein [Salmonella enterica subsp. houtenae serovar 17:z29:-]